MTKTSAVTIAKVAARAADSKKADNVQVLKMPEVMVEAEYFVICSASTHVQLRVIVDEVIAALQQEGVELLRQEGGPRQQLDSPGLRRGDCPRFPGRRSPLLRPGKAVG